MNRPIVHGSYLVHIMHMRVLSFYCDNIVDIQIWHTLAKRWRMKHVNFLTRNIQNGPSTHIHFRKLDAGKIISMIVHALNVSLHILSDLRIIAFPPLFRSALTQTQMLLNRCATFFCARRIMHIQFIACVVVESVRTARTMLIHLVMQHMVENFYASPRPHKSR